MMASPTTSGSRPDLARPPPTFILFRTFHPAPFAPSCGPPASDGIDSRQLLLHVGLVGGHHDGLNVFTGFHRFESFFPLF